MVVKAMDMVGLCAGFETLVWYYEGGDSLEAIMRSLDACYVPCKPEQNKNIFVIDVSGGDDIPQEMAFAVIEMAQQRGWYVVVEAHGKQFSFWYMKANAIEVRVDGAKRDWLQFQAHAIVWVVRTQAIDELIPGEPELGALNNTAQLYIEGMNVETYKQVNKQLKNRWRWQG